MNLALIADDEINQTELIKYHLEKAGFNTLVAMDGEAAFDLICENRPDIVILDWMMPNESGISVCRKVRSKKEIKDTPIIILSARGEDIDTSHGLLSGADDYITKPFSPIELIARVKALLRRTSAGSNTNIQKYCDLEINNSKKEVLANGQIIKVSKVEFNIISLLISRPEQVFSRNQIIDKVWGNEKYIDDRTVDVHVSRLRKLIKSNYKGQCKIKTVHGFGYSLTKN